METLKLTIGWIITGLIFMLGIIVIVRIIQDRINLDKLLCEANGDASRSRFQLLVFTFVISMTLCYVTISKGGGVFPEIPGGILALLGISGGSYIAAKQIQAGKETTVAKAAGPGDGAVG
jgi:hypothetical protein